MDSCELWCRVTVTHDGGSEFALSICGAGVPGIEAVDAVARLSWLARRAGASVHLSHVSREMRELLDLAGLSVEMQWEAEGGEEQLRLHRSEEDRQLGDLPS